MDDESQELLPGIRGVLHVALSEPPHPGDWSGM
jgi:hypothetical protein